MSHVRELAYVEKVSAVEPHPNDPNTDLIHIRGWVCAARHQQFASGDWVVFCEPDSILPKNLALLKPIGCNAKGIVRTISIGEIQCQGAVFHLHDVFPDIEIIDREPVTRSDHPPIMLGSPLTNILGITKREDKTEPSAILTSGGAKHPDFFPRSDQERVQNLNALNYRDMCTFEVTEKLDGSSISIYWHDGTIGLCSHNVKAACGELDEGGAAFVLRRKGIFDALRKYAKEIVIQGELIGPRLNKNHLGLKHLDFRIFDIYDIDQQRFMTPEERHQTLYLMGLGDPQQHVPVLYRNFRLPEKPQTTEEMCSALLEFASGTSVLDETKPREGLVFKSETLVVPKDEEEEKKDHKKGHTVHFKAVSPTYLHH